MATVNFSVPDEVKKKFDRQFAGRNKSRVIAELMERAVEEERAAMKRAQAVDRILARRRLVPRVRAAQVRAARKSVRG